MSEHELLEAIREVVFVDSDGLLEIDRDGWSYGFGERGPLALRLPLLRDAIDRAIAEGVVLP